MSIRSDVAPSTLPVELLEEGVQVEYLDGRTTLYRGVPQKAEETLTTAPGKEVHVLVTDSGGTEGVMLYVNDRKTHDEILQDAGVGRVIIEPGEQEQLFPGVDALHENYRIQISADPGIARGRVFVFIEDDLGEASYEIVGAD